MFSITHLFNDVQYVVPSKSLLTESDDEMCDYDTVYHVLYNVSPELV
jgi:hypothetical protein